MTVEQQLAATQRVLRATQRRNTQMHMAHRRLLECENAEQLWLALRSYVMAKAFLGCIGERLFTESEVRPLVAVIAEYLSGHQGHCVPCHRHMTEALTHAKELGL